MPSHRPVRRSTRFVSPGLIALITAIAALAIAAPASCRHRQRLLRLHGNVAAGESSFNGSYTGSGNAGLGSRDAQLPGASTSASGPARYK